MFIDEKVHYLDIHRLNEACCEAHTKEWVGSPDLETIVHFDAWARKWVQQYVESGAFKSKVTTVMAA